ANQKSANQKPAPLPILTNPRPPPMTELRFHRGSAGTTSLCPSTQPLTPQPHNRARVPRVGALTHIGPCGCFAHKGLMRKASKPKVRSDAKKMASHLSGL